MARIALAFFLTVLLGAPARAELKVGDPAPPLKAAKWVKGKPVTLADGKGKSTYVVEFWATWCIPCVESIPHLSKMAGHFENKDVTFIGVSIDNEDTRDKVEPFVKKMGKKMEYTVALDAGGATSKAYMEAAGVRGIPHAFIVGKDGAIAWHGHPMEGLDLKLAELVGDRDYAQKAASIQKNRMSLSDAWEKENWDGSLAAVEKLIELDPDDHEMRMLKYLILASRKKDAEAAARWGQDTVKRSDDPEQLNDFAWGILTDDEYKGARDQKLALAAARKANDLSEGKSWSIADTYARALFDSGSPKEAVDQEKKALEMAKKEEVGGEQLAQLEKALARFERGPAKPGPETEKKDAKE
jgi:thiol-disulfide isomerase/thioredoxin